MAKIQKVCIVTGASSGLGFETSKKMAVLGYEVVLACGDKVKAKQAISRIKQDLPDAKLIYMNLDLASFSSIAKFAKTFHNADKKLNVLVNNAAWMDKSSSRVPSAALECLISSTVVKQASKDFLSLDIDDIQLLKPGSYTGSIAYKNSKIASFLFALELHRRLEGSGVTCNIINPGKYVRSTNIFRNQGCFRKYMFPCLCLCSGTNLGRAASAVVFVATDCELSRVSGRCFVGSEESTIQIETRDLDSAKQLWDLSKGMVADAL